MRLAGRLIAIDGWRGRVLVLRTDDGARTVISHDWTPGGQWVAEHHLRSHPVLSRKRYVVHNDGRTGLGRVRVHDLSLHGLA